MRKAIREHILPPFSRPRSGLGGAGGSESLLAATISGQGRGGVVLC